MNEKIESKPISSYTLKELMAASGEMGDDLSRECFAAVSQSQMQYFSTPSRIDALILGVGTEGEASVSCNLQEYKLHQNSFFLFGPQTILQVNTSESFRAHVLVVAPEFLQRINVDIKRIIPLFMQLGMPPSLDITNEECESLSLYIALIEREVNSNKSEFARDVVSSLISAAIYKIADILQHNLAIHPELNIHTKNRSEEYFRQFIRLLGENFKRERSVAFYARQLCITPKYLTTLIRQISGRSVSEWIDTYVVLEAKTLLRYSNMSVQEIAYHLNFPNQSFFGSYFKRNTGLSPSGYKAEK